MPTLQEIEDQYRAQHAIFDSNAEWAIRQIAKGIHLARERDDWYERAEVVAAERDEAKSRARQTAGCSRAPWHRHRRPRPLLQVQVRTRCRPRCVVSLPSRHRGARMTAYEAACLEGRALSMGRCGVNGCTGDRVVCAQIVGTAQVTYQCRCTACRRESYVPEWASPPERQEPT